MKCAVCGVELKDTDKFCGICGTPNPSFISDVQPVRPEYPAIDENETDDLPIFSDGGENSEEMPLEEEAVSETDIEASAEENYYSRFTAEEKAAGETDVGEGTDGEKAAQNAAYTDKKQAATPQKEDFRGGCAPPPPHLPYNIPAANYEAYNGKKQPKKKEKRVCSLSAVVFCIIVILILSVACGVLGGMYMWERNYRLDSGYGRRDTAYSYTIDN